MPRLLNNWLLAFRDWTVPRSEAQETLILWCGLFTIAAAMKRKVCFPKSLLGSYEIYPNLYIIFVGPPGIVRKSTTAGYAEDLLLDSGGMLGSVGLAEVSSTAMSVSKMVEVMSKAPDSAISIVSSEFSSFVNISKDEMYDALTDLYDNKKVFIYSTRMYGHEIVEFPSVNMLACTTPEWVSTNMPISAIGGGFASRVIFIFENRVRRRRMYYDEVSAQTNFADLEDSLRGDLAHIANLEGEFTHDSKETKDAIEEWYQRTADLPASDPRIEGYLHRKHVHAHKVAMILSLAERDDLIITMNHFEIAKSMLAEIEVNMPRVFTGIGRNPYSADMEGVLDFLASRGDWIAEELLVRRFSHDLPSAALSEILTTLQRAGFVEKGRGDGMTAYRVTDSQ